MSQIRVFLLGLDGATWKVISRFIQRGSLPNLARLLEQGTSGVLNSTIPYLTPVAWASLLTGVGPAKHGIFGYNVMKNSDGIVSGSLANRSKIKVATVMDIYAQLGRKVISINVPMTYPPRPHDGIIITGLMTPSRESRFYHPPDLLTELSAQGIDYRIDISAARDESTDLNERLNAYLADGGKRFFDDLRNVTHQRHRAVLYLLENKPWDLFQVNFITMDRIQHYLWKHIWDESAPALDQINEQFNLIDSIVGEIYERVKDKAVLVICSDHGFGDYSGNFYPVVWLKQQGYYFEKTSHEVTSLARRLARRLGITGKVRRLLERSKSTSVKELVFKGISNVAWEKTRAYVYSTSGIRINLRGRDQYGIVEPGSEYESLRAELREKLLALTDEHGERVIKAVHYAEDLYGVANLEEEPDLMFEFKDDHFYTTYYTVTDAPHWFDKCYTWRQGDHRRDGIILLIGDGICKDKRITAEIQDVLPTILFIQDLPQSDNFDGQVILEAFESSFIEQRKQPPPRSFSREAIEVSDEPSDEVIDRLKGLGYI